MEASVYRFFLLFFLCLYGLPQTKSQPFIGVNYGQTADNLPPPSATAKLLRSTTIQKVRLYGSDPAIIKALANTGIEIVIGTGDVPGLASDPSFARSWVETNVVPYYPASKITLIDVGNEATTFGDRNFMLQLLPAMKNVQSALEAASLGGKIKVSTVHTMSILSQSDPPSAGVFAADHADILKGLLEFNRETGSPFAVNPYPFFAYQSDPRPETLAFCLFQPNPGRVDANSKIKYMNMFDAQSNLLSNGEEQRNGDGKRKRLKISVAHFDNSALIRTYSKTLIGRCMNPVEQEMKALFTNLPKIWKLEERVTGSDLGFGKFQFDFMTEEELDAVLRQQPYHFDYWMLALAKWQPKQLKDFPSEIPFWIRVFGLPLEFRTAPTLESIGGALGRVVDVDVVQNRVQVIIDAFKELCFETSIDFKGGEFYEEEEVAVSLRYEKLFGYCKGCGSLCHKEEICPLDEKNTKAEPERRREHREGNGGWTDGVKHEERARSYKGVVINGNTAHQNRERDCKEYYGKGKGKMGEAPDSKWVKVPERGNRRSYNHHGNYRGNGEGSRVKSTYREAVPVVGSGTQGVSTKTYPLQRREDQGQHQDVHPAREEGEITMNEDADATLPSAEFQMELAKTQAEGSEVVVEAMEEEKNLLAVQGLMEKHDEPFDDIEMEIEAINAAMMASGVDLEAEEEFQTLSEEEFEQDSEAQIEKVLLQNAEEPVAGDAHINKELGTGEVATRQGHRKRLFKPNNSTAGSTKMRMASALLSPRKKTAAAAAKVGTRHGDNTKPPESKGPSIPKPVNLKF